MIAKHHEDSRTKLVSSWNPAKSTMQKGYWKQGRPAKIWEDDLNIYLQPYRSNRDDNDLAADSNNQRDPRHLSKRQRQANQQRATKQ